MVYSSRRGGAGSVSLDAHWFWFLLCDFLAFRYPKLNSSSLDSKILMSVKSQHEKLPNSVEIGPNPPYQ